jgi:hypothetical protein
MSTRYLVKCPHPGCQWLGNLPASPDVESWRGSSINVSIVAFQCPCCHQVWRGRLIGDDLEMLPLDVEEDLASVWPQVDLGDGG